MSESYCGPCGHIHSVPVNESCRAVKASKRNTRSATSKEGKMSDAGEFIKEEKLALEGDDTLPDLDVEEREALERVRVLERRKKILELNRREEELREEMSRLAVRPSRTSVQPGDRRSVSRGADGPRRSETRSRSVVSSRDGAGRRRRSSSSSSSEGRTPSRERRARSKWSLKRHVENRRDVKKLSPFELIEASCAWVLDTRDTDYDCLRKFIKHIGYMAGKAKSGIFLDKAHNLYDQSVRKLATSEGFNAFSAGNAEYSLKHYTYENMKKHAGSSGQRGAGGSYGGGGKNLFTRGGKKPCFSHNKEGGCSRDERTCGYGHWCSRCGSRSHTRLSCPKD